MNSPIVQRIDDITKSRVDNREYRGLVLSNDLKVFLISDSLADKAAASLAVRVGHLNDPWEVPGVAHFCEHMLFLGTEKYPEENEYSKYVAKNAGEANAYTSTDGTNYHFEVQASALEGGLDRFLQFFLTPQFTESATEKEVNAVDNEHSNNIGSDSWRLLQLNRSLATPGHAYGKFGTGNKKTLMLDTKEKGVEVRDVLLDFHKKHYSSNAMGLVVAGKESLDDLEQMIVDLGFGNIENKKVKPIVYGPAYGPEECGRALHVVSIKEMRALAITFPFPDLAQDYRSDPAGYISHLIGHEGLGSVMSHLKNKGWLWSLSSSHHTIAEGFGDFTIAVDMTLDGMNHVEEIITEIFRGLALIRNSGPVKWIHDELKDIRSIQFDFKDKEPPLRIANAVSASLHQIPMKDVLSAERLIHEYAPNRIMELLDLLTPDRMWYRVVSKQYEGAEGMKTEPIYGTKYKLDKIPEETMQKFRDAYYSKETPAYLYLPSPNPYVPTQLSLKEKCSVQGKYPTLLRDDRWSRVWFKQDDEFKQPKAIAKIMITSPFVGLDPMNMAATAIALNTFQDSLTEFLYLPELAGINYQVDVVNTGFHFKVRGFDEKMTLFLRDFLERLVYYKPDRTKFENAKERFLRNLRNLSHSQPYNMAQGFTSVMTMERVWSKEQLLAVAKLVTFEQATEAIKAALAAFHAEALVYGNMTDVEALELVDTTVGQLKAVNPLARTLFANEAVLRRDIDVGIGNSFVYRHPQTTHEVSCVQALLQVGVRNKKENCLLFLLVQTIDEPSFNILRTNEQLGYIVASWPYRSPSAHSLCILVQGKADPDTVDDRIENFLVAHARPLIANITDEEFNKNVESCVHALEEKPKTLGQSFSQFWMEIESRMYNFEKCEQEAAMLKTITKAELLEFFDKKIAPGAPERRKFAIYVHSKGDTEEEINELRKGQGRRRRDAGDSVEREERKGEKTEIKYVDALRDSLGYFGRPTAALDLPPIGTGTLDRPEE